jgi:hypothetical protein
MVMRRVGALYAIDGRDLDGILKKLGIYQDVVEGRTRCYFCGRSVSMRNLGGLFKHEGLIRLVCSDIKCLYEAAWLTARRRHVK